MTIPSDIISSAKRSSQGARMLAAAVYADETSASFHLTARSSHFLKGDEVDPIFAPQKSSKKKRHYLNILRQSPKNHSKSRSLIVRYGLGKSKKKLSSGTFNSDKQVAFDTEETKQEEQPMEEDDTVAAGEKKPRKRSFKRFVSKLAVLEEKLTSKISTTTSRVRKIKWHNRSRSRSSEPSRQALDLSTSGRSDLPTPRESRSGVSSFRWRKKSASKKSKKPGQPSSDQPSKRESRASRVSGSLRHSRTRESRSVRDSRSLRDSRSARDSTPVRDGASEKDSRFSSEFASLAPTSSSNTSATAASTDIGNATAGLTLGTAEGPSGSGASTTVSTPFSTTASTDIGGDSESLTQSPADLEDPTGIDTGFLSTESPITIPCGSTAKSDSPSSSITCQLQVPPDAKKEQPLVPCNFDLSLDLSNVFMGSHRGQPLGPSSYEKEGPSSSDRQHQRESRWRSSKQWGTRSSANFHTDNSFPTRMSTASKILDQTSPSPELRHKEGEMDPKLTSSISNPPAGPSGKSSPQGERRSRSPKPDLPSNPPRGNNKSPRRGREQRSSPCRASGNASSPIRKTTSNPARASGNVSHPTRRTTTSPSRASSNVPPQRENRSRSVKPRETLSDSLHSNSSCSSLMTPNMLPTVESRERLLEEAKRAQHEIGISALEEEIEMLKNIEGLNALLVRFVTEGRLAMAGRIQLQIDNEMAAYDQLGITRASSATAQQTSDVEGSSSFHNIDTSVSSTRRRDKTRSEEFDASVSSTCRKEKKAERSPSSSEEFGTSASSTRRRDKGRSRSPKEEKPTEARRRHSGYISRKSCSFSS